MIYMLKVDVLVATIVFAFAAVLILIVFAWTQAKAFAHALRAMRIAPVRRRELFVISRSSSRNRKANSFRAA